MRDAVLDLVLGSRCAVCERPGSALCEPCRRVLPRRAETRWPSPRPPGLVRPTAVGDYDGPLKLLVNAHKERQRFALARPLGELLAIAVLDHLPDPAGPDPAGPDPAGPDAGERRVLLVPVPSRRAVVRSRGHDPLLRVARVAAGRLRGRGVSARVVRCLRAGGAVEDQAGLGAAARADNLAGTMSATRVASGLAGTRPPVLVVDDVITTGATVREAQRALVEAGVEVLGVATVAATRRRHEVVQNADPGFPAAGDESDTSLPFSVSAD